MSAPASCANPETLAELEAQIFELSMLVARLRTTAGQAVGRPPSANVVYETLRARQRRDAIFGDPLFGEPAWDLLLQLYAAEREGRRLLVSTACEVSGVPLTTGLRWIEKLEKSGWLRRVPDRDRGRRVFAVLTRRASEAMQSYFSATEL